MHRGTWNKRMAAAEDRILEAGDRLLMMTSLSKRKKSNLRKAVKDVRHHNADIRRLRRFEAIATLVEAAVDSFDTFDRESPVEESLEEVAPVETAVDSLDNVEQEEEAAVETESAEEPLEENVEPAGESPEEAEPVEEPADEAEG